MISEINLSDFRKKLQENTQIGIPAMKVSPFAIFTFFGNSDKKFYGKFDNNSFRFTKNGTINVVPKVIKGTVNENPDSQTIVKYEIKTIWLGYFWLRTIPLFIAGLFFIIEHFYGKEFRPLAIFTSLLLLLFHFYLLQSQRKDLKKFEADFKRIFKIAE